MAKTDKKLSGGGGEGVSANSPLNAALTSLLVSEAEYADRLAEVRGVIAGLRKMLGVADPPAPSRPAPRAAAKPRNMKVPDPEDGDSKGDKARAAICASLKRGALSTVDIAHAVRMNKTAVGYHLRQLKADDQVVFVGLGRATKVALAGMPAKEAP